MSDLMYFDCNATVGHRPQKHRRVRWTTEHLIEDMDLAEIAGALATHGLARSYDHVYGNARLTPELAKAPDRVFGVWCVAPLGDPGFYRTGDELLRAMEAQDIRAVRVVPGGFSLHHDVMGETFEALQDNQILTLLEQGWG